jgi:DNA-binding transcriptional regulator YdaS (Cro superfamily)
MPEAQTPPNLMKLAIVAAGGTLAVAARHGVRAETVSRWISGDLTPPPAIITDLVAAMGGLVTEAQVLGYIADRAEERAAAARAAAQAAA